MQGNWESEFGKSYAVPIEVLRTPGLADISWHNDICPSFAWEVLADVAADDSGKDLRLWVEHVDPTRREYGEGYTRFNITLDSEMVWEGEDIAEGLRVMASERDKLI